MIRIDMHTHSHHSDGTLSPEELVRLAKKRRVSILSLTDHDTIAGLSAFQKACNTYNIKGISGVELSAEAPYTLHILGYRIDAKVALLSEKLEELRRHRKKRNEEICQKLQQLGLDVTIEEVEAEASGEAVTRPHIARVMLHKGYVPDIPSAFQKYIGRGGPAYVDRVRFDKEECVELILESGGLPVLAHPNQCGLGDDELEALLKSLKEIGLWGLECYHPVQTSSQIFDYLKLARDFDLFPTAGSDFHGSNRPGVDLGIEVEETLLPWWRLGIEL